MLKKLLIVIFVAGLLLRTFDLQNHPVGFTPDEASFGYDAYSLLKTGQDQWGNSYPINLKSFGDYKLPIYSYLAMPFIALFDLNVVATRLPNAILGSLSIIAVYYLVSLLFKDKRIAIFSSLLISFSPWHIALSRGAFEANLTTFFLPAGLYFLYKGFKNKNYLILSAILLGINLFTYHTARIVTLPVVIAFIFTFYQSKAKSFRKYFELKQFAYTLGFFVLLTAFAMFNGGGGRISSSSLFSISDNVYNTRFDQLIWGEPAILNTIFNNKLTFVTEGFTHNYLSYFSPQFLLTEGAREHTYGMPTSASVILLFEFITILSSIYLLTKKISRNHLFILFWILLAPIPAALSIGPGHAANRAAFMMPALQIFSAVGLVYLLDMLSKKLSKNILYSAFLIIFVFSFGYSIERYWFNQQTHGASAMFYGVDQLVEYVQSVEDQYDQIIITRELSEGHMFFAFFTKLDPNTFQNFSKTWDIGGEFTWVDQQPEYHLYKYTFTNMDWQRDRNLSNALVIGKKDDFPEGVESVKEIYYPNADIIFKLVETRSNAFAYVK